LHFLSAAPQAGSSQRIEMENLGSDVLKAVYRDGWLYLMTNRAIPDAELDDFVDRFSRRIASFEKKALTEAKRLVNRSSLLPDDASLVAAGETFIHMLTWPETRSRIAKILERGLQKPGDFELRLGHHLGIE
jgi:hypothetical protein